MGKMSFLKWKLERKEKEERKRNVVIKRIKEGKGKKRR